MAHDLLDWLESLSTQTGEQPPSRSWDGSPPTPPAALAAAESELGVSFPTDYRDLLLASDGGELTGPRESITLERVEDLVDRNTEDRYLTALAGLPVIGSNAGGAIYFYDPHGQLGRGDWALYWVNLGDLATENARFAGHSLSEALHRIADGVEFFSEPPR